MRRRLPPLAVDAEGTRLLSEVQAVAGDARLVAVAEDLRVHAVETGRAALVSKGPVHACDVEVGERLGTQDLGVDLDGLGRASDDEAVAIYVEYGRRIEKLLAGAGAKVEAYGS